jgi:hypothetical protein
VTKFFREEDHDWVRGRVFADTTAPELLSHVEAARPRGSKPPAWVLDLDSTLFCVGPRIRAVYGEFLRRHPSPRPEWERVYPFLESTVQRYSIEGTFEKIFAIWDSRDAHAKAVELWDAFRDFWNEEFFSNRHLRRDIPYPGARDFVEGLVSKGYEIVYLTGRDRPRTGAGTVEALRQGRFPLGPSTHLFMKPDRETSDLDYKHLASQVLRGRFDVRALVDNEPENLVMFAREFPAAEVVFFHTIMSRRVPLEDYAALLGYRRSWRLHSWV